MVAGHAPNVTPTAGRLREIITSDWNRSDLS